MEKRESCNKGEKDAGKKRVRQTMILEYSKHLVINFKVEGLLIIINKLGASKCFLCWKNTQCYFWSELFTRLIYKHFGIWNFEKHETKLSCEPQCDK